MEPTCPTSKLLRKGDILLQFDDTEIGVDGTVAFRSGERINFSYLISEKQNNDKVRIWSLQTQCAPCSVRWQASKAHGHDCRTSMSTCT